MKFLSSILWSKTDLQIDEITLKLKSKGRLFYIGTGTSGRLGVLDASECPPTFCTSPELVQAIIAGGDKALKNSSEGLEDSVDLPVKDLQRWGGMPFDVTPYMVKTYNKYIEN